MVTPLRPVTPSGARHSPATPVVQAPEPRDRYTAGNHVYPLHEGSEVVDTAVEAIRKARHGVQVEMYRLGYDRLVDVLAEQARRGVEVQVLLDPTVYDEEHRRRRDAVVEFLRSEGVDVRFYPLRENRQIDHVKLLVVDGHYALIGGMNWDRHSPLNADHSLFLSGPAAVQLHAVFENDWQISGGDPLPLPDPPPPPSDPEPVDGRLPADTEARVRVATTRSREGDRGIRQMVLERIQAARESIYMEAFALADEQVIEGLIAARQRGVDVRVLLDPNKPIVYQNRRAAERLRAAGVEVRWLDTDVETEEKLHSKMMLVDREATIVGSANFTHAGLAINHEASVEVLSRAVGRAFERVFLHRWEERGLTFLPDRPDYRERIPGEPPAEQYAEELFREFSEYFHPGERRNWVGQRKAAILAALEKHRGQRDLRFDPEEPEETTIGKLAAFLEARGLVRVRPDPGTPEPLWRERHRLAIEAMPRVARETPRRVRELASAPRDPELKALIARAQASAPRGYFAAPADSEPDRRPADTLRPEDLSYRGRAREPYRGGGLVLDNRRAQVLAEALAEFYGLDRRQTDQVLAALAVRDLTRGVDPEAVRRAPDPRELEWQLWEVDRRREGAVALLERLGYRGPVRGLVATSLVGPPEQPDLRHLVMSLAVRLAEAPNFYVPA